MARRERPDHDHVERLAKEVVDASVWLHRRAGPGMLESVYQRLLAQELQRRGLRVRRHPRLSFEMEGLVFEGGLIPDLLVDEVLIVEVKAVQDMKPVFWRQVLTYLRALDLPLGFLVNFGGATLKGGIHRVVNNHRR